jgi:choline dehydrogenase-like flavoprotein
MTNVFIIRIVLQIAVNSQVTKVLIDPETKIARGVEYIDQEGNTQTVYALKEVILSAGAINSPQLLLLSGVGPREDLTAVGIDTIVDLPGVGQNLQNHVAGSIGFYMEEPSTDSLTLEALREFVGNRTGNMASTGLTQTTLLMTSKYAKDGVSDLQVNICFQKRMLKLHRISRALFCQITSWIPYLFFFSSPFIIFVVC